jgi:hypothetical protein
VAAAAAVAAVLLVGPAVIDSVDGLRNDPGQSAGLQPDRRAPAATSDVVTLQTINGADILTWYERSDWCTVTTRVHHNKACLGPVDARHQGFGWVLAPRSPSLTVDTSHVVAGVLPPGAVRVVVHMKNGHEYDAAVVRGAGFVLPVWSVLVDDRRTTVDYYAALDGNGIEIDRKAAS